MPLWLRNYTFSEIQKFYSKKQEAENKASQGQNSTSANIGDPIPAHMKKALQQTKPLSSYTTQKSKK